MTHVPAIVPVDSAARRPGSLVCRTSCVRGLRIRLPGTLLIFVTCLVGIASFTSEANLLLLLCGMSLGCLLFSVIGCMLAVRKIDVNRTVSDTVMVGRPFQITYTIRNRQRWLKSWSIRCGEVPVERRQDVLPQAFLPVLGPGGEITVETQAKCMRRGRVGLRAIRICSGFPFGLFTCRVDIAARRDLLVHPALGQLRRDMWRGHRVNGSDAHRANNSTGHDEFHGVREYRQGDNPRWIHWRRSARTGQLIVRETVAIQQNQMLVLVDPWPECGRGSASSHRTTSASQGISANQDADAERIISAAATVICDALDHGYRVGLVARAFTPVIIAPSGGRAHRHRLMRELALLAPGDGRDLGEMVAEMRWSSGWDGRCLLFAAQAAECHQRVIRMLTARSEIATMVTPHSGWLERFVVAPATEHGGEGGGTG